MANAGDILKKFYAAVIKRDLTEARRYLDERLQFVGLFETYRTAEEYLSALTKLLQVTWHQFQNGKISHVESAFDGRPFAAMFAGGKR